MNEQKKPTAPTEKDEPATEADKPYDREKKLKELLEEDEKRSPYADPFMGF